MTKPPSRRRRGTITIEDVARAAGVSAMTVSRVVNGGRNVRETTRNAVLEAVKKLNYSPNTAARSLAAGEATHIGMLYANPSAAYLSQFLIGALHAARRAGCHLVIESCESEDADEQAEVTRRFATSDVEGVVLPPPLSESQPIIAELAAIGIPVVTVAMGTPQEDSLNVGIDDSSLATTVWPELTTVKQPISAMAEAALELLLADLRGRRSGAPRHFAERVLDHELIVRESSSAPGAPWVGWARRARTVPV